jgi:hypothetical protein
MKRLVLLVPLLVTLFVAANGAWCDQPGLENNAWESVDDRVAPERSGFRAFGKECQEVFDCVKSALETYIHTVVTVGKVVIKVLQALVVSVAKLIVKAAVGLAVIVARWLLDLLIPF